MKKFKNISIVDHTYDDVHQIVRKAFELFRDNRRIFNMPWNK
jgi:hypothetical protein